MSKRCKDLKSEKDRISSLPDDIIDNILVRLSLEEAINTSLLSKDWRYKWRTMSEVIIHHSSSFSNSENFSAKVKRFLLLHQGNIQKFHYNGSDHNYEDMNIWLNHLDSAHLRHLELTMHKDSFIPPCVFSFEKLITLNLEIGKIILPVSFARFQSLTTLSFNRIKFIDDGYKKLQELIHLCPILKDLKLFILLDDTKNSVFKLNAPNLHSLIFFDPRNSLRIMNSPLIASASLYSQELIDSLYDLSNVSHLRIGVQFTSASFYHPSYRSLSLQEIKFKFLKELQLGVNFQHFHQYEIALCIIINSPALVYLVVHQIPRIRSLVDHHPIWPNHNKISFEFTHLKFFEMTIAFGSKWEMRFVEFVFRNAPLLKVSILKWSPYCTLGIEEKMNILRKLLSVKRASTSVEVKFR